MAVHDVDMEPVGALLNLLGAVMAQIGEVGAQNRGGNDRGGCHGEYGEYEGEGQTQKEKEAVDIRVAKGGYLGLTVGREYT